MKVGLYSNLSHQYIDSGHPLIEQKNTPTAPMIFANAAKVSLI